jgi:hypothetical protein
MNQGPYIKPCENCIGRRTSLYGSHPLDLPHVLDDLAVVKVVTKPTIDQTLLTCNVCGSHWTVETSSDADRPGELRYGWWV